MRTRTEISTTINQLSEGRDTISEIAISNMAIVELLGDIRDILSTRVK